MYSRPHKLQKPSAHKMDRLQCLLAQHSHSSGLLLLLLLLLLTILLPGAAGVLRMKGQPVMAIVGFSLLFSDPSNVRASRGVPFSRMALAGGSVGEVRFLSRSITLLLIRYTTCM
jgi:hypothetical protein